MNQRTQKTLKLLTKNSYERNRNFILYSIIGISGVSLDFVFFLFFYNSFVEFNIIFPSLMANILSTTIGITNNFILNAIFNFKKTDHLKYRFLSFFAVGISGITISGVIIFLLSEIHNYNATYVKILTIFVVTILQYNLNKNFSFNDRKIKK